MKEQARHVTVFRVIFWTSVPTLRMAKPRLDSLEGWTNSPGLATGSGKAPGPVPSQVLPQWVEVETDHLLGAPRKEHQIGRTGDSWGREALWLITSLEFPGREQQLRKPGDLEEGRHCDSHWMWLRDCWLNRERNFSFYKLQNQLFLHMQLKTTSLLKGLPGEKLEVSPFHVLEIHSLLCLRPQPWAN